MKRYGLLLVGLLILVVTAGNQTGQKSLHLVVLGSSTAEGGGASCSDSAWVNRYRAFLQSINSQSTVTNLARGGYTSYHIRPTGDVPPASRPFPDSSRNITKALSFHPDAIIINLPSNDVAYGYSITEQLANYDTVLAVARARKVPVWITTTQPRHLSSSGRKTLMDLRDSILARWDRHAIDLWKALAQSDGRIAQNLDSGDGIHLNDAGHRVLFERVVKAGIVDFLKTGADASRVSPAAQVRVLDDFESAQDWRIIASDGVSIDTSSTEGFSGKCIKIDFNFVTGAGYGGIQKRLPIQLPSNYQFSFYVRGEAPVNNLEFKLVDTSGDNVWWVNHRNFEFPREWQKITIKKRQISFAWGPTQDKNLSGIDKIEFIIASATGGQGSVYLDELRFEELEIPSPEYPKPNVSASSAARDHEPADFIFDHNPTTGWRSLSKPEAQYIIIDFQKRREYGGVIIDWDEKDFAQQYYILISNDGTNWERAYAVSHGKGGRSYINLRDSESRYLKLDLLQSSRGQGYAVNELTVKNVDFSETPEAFFSHIAKDLPRGRFPKYFYNEASYWTVVGVDRDEKEALINEEGMVEVDKRCFSIEPFIFNGQQFITWNDAKRSQYLEEDYLPIPSVIWEYEKLQLRTQIFAHGPSDSSILYIRYTLKNKGRSTAVGSFFVTLRPFQVNPPWQFLNNSGGTAKIQSLSHKNDSIAINDKKVVLPLTPPDDFGALEFDQGEITDYLSQNRLPRQTEVVDHFGYASAALKYAYHLQPSEEKRIILAVPFHENYESVSGEHAEAIFERRLKETAAFWKTKLNQVEFNLPASANKLVNTLRTNLAYILINRDRAGFQPGSRSYERSWIRDGAMTSSALLKMGLHEEVKAFLDWYSTYQYDNGKIPCVVDRRGPDPVPEHDSNGEFIYGILQYFLFTGDTTFLRQKFSHVKKAVAYLNFLISQRSTDYYQHGGDSLRAFYGILPESISHEGYSAKPMHSYWDDFWALKGVKDASTIADILGEQESLKTFQELRDTFKENLYHSLNLAIKNKGIDYIPGCVELGDFDAASTTIAIHPCNELENLLRPFLSNTFDKYYYYFQQRLQPEFVWENYTPYELRIVGSFIYLNQSHRAHELLKFFLADQRPSNWNHWAEVVWRNRQTPRFIGDMPHTWVGSDYINSIRSFFVYENEMTQSLVIAGGFYEDWIDFEEEMTINNLPTLYGQLNYSVKKITNGYAINLAGNVKIPKGEIIIRNLENEIPKSVIVNGKQSQNFDINKIIVTEFPARLEVKY